MRRWAARLVASMLLLAPSLAGIAVACNVGDVDYAGKSCPCPSGWACIAGVCSQSTQSKPGDGSGTESGADSGAPFIQVSNLRALWTTANVIRWTWDVTGEAANFGSYALDITSDNPDAGGGVKTWTAADNAELGAFDLPLPYGGVTPVVATMTDTHDPNTTYTAVLSATDTEGRVSRSNEAVAVTGVIPLNGRIVIFDGTRPPGAWLLPPTGTGIVSGCGVDGGACFQLMPSEDKECHFEAGPQCTGNLQLGFDTIATTAVEPSFATNAYVEFYYHYDGDSPSYWSSTWLQFVEAGTCADVQFCLWGLQPWTISHAQAYRRLQIPLRMLLQQVYDENSDATATATGFASGLIEFELGGGWLPNTSVAFDRVTIWY
jgi:hypothetical protein